MDLLCLRNKHAFATRGNTMGEHVYKLELLEVILGVFYQFNNVNQLKAA